MSDWPSDVVDEPTFGILSPCSIGSPLSDLIGLVPMTTTGSAWPVANLALYLPILVRTPVTAFQLGWLNAATVSGNVDAGIYDRNGNRLVSAGSTAMSGSSAIQLVDTADTTLPPDLYYLAMACDNTTATFARASLSGAAAWRTSGVAQQASAFPLPSTAAFAAMAQTVVPDVFAAIATATF